MNFSSSNNYFSPVTGLDAQDCTIVLVVVDSHDDCMKAAEAALKLQPDHPSALSALALVYRKIGRSEEAEQLYQR